MKKTIYNFIAVAAVAAMAFSCDAGGDIWSSLKDGDLSGRGDYYAESDGGVPSTPGAPSGENGQGTGQSGTEIRTCRHDARYVDPYAAGIDGCTAIHVS